MINYTCRGEELLPEAAWMQAQHMGVKDLFSFTIKIKKLPGIVFQAAPFYFWIF